MAPSHAMTGVLTGVAATFVAAPLLAPDLWTTATTAVLTAGAALLPDLDHPQATATRSQGPVSRAACTGVRALSARVWRATATPRDGGGWDADGTHRHLSHTVPAALLVGLVAGLVSLWWLGALLVAWLLASLALRGLFGRAARSWLAVSGVAAVVAALAVVVADLPAWWLGALVAVGMVTHVLGDALTPAGVPLLWPLARRGSRWWMVSTPFTLTTGTRGEKAVQVISGAGTVSLVLLLAA
ncbi:metal-dependent hydrolase [Salinactinospora qingdaonensis]